MAEATGGVTSAPCPHGRASWASCPHCLGVNRLPMPETPVSVWQGEMTLLGVTLHLHVLDDGTRIIEAADMVALLEAMEHVGPADVDEMAAFARWQRGADD